MFSGVMERDQGHKMTQVYTQSLYLTNAKPLVPNVFRGHRKRILTLSRSLAQNAAVQV